MCCPRLKNSFLCCSLRTGILLICWTSLLWNIFFLFIGNQPPLILEFLQEEHQVNLSREKFLVFGQLYYAVEMLIMSFALIGICSNKSLCLNLLVGSETVILLFYFLMALTEANRSLMEKNKLDAGSIYMFLILGAKYYVYLVIISFYHEVTHGRDGTGQSGWVINNPPIITIPPSAPSAGDLTVETAHFVDTPYAVQPPHAPLPYPITYSQNEHLIPQQVSDNPQTYYSPPPYPISSAKHCENPPPYAP